MGPSPGARGEHSAGQKNFDLVNASYLTVQVVNCVARVAHLRAPIGPFR